MGDDFSDVFTLFTEPLWFIKKKSADGPNSFLTVNVATNNGRIVECVVLCSTFEFSLEFVRKHRMSETHEPVTTKTADDFAIFLESLIVIGKSHVCIDPGLPDSRVHTIRSLLDAIRDRHRAG